MVGCSKTSVTGKAASQNDFEPVLQLDRHQGVHPHIKKPLLRIRQLRGRELQHTAHFGLNPGAQEIRAIACRGLFQLQQEFWLSRGLMSGTLFRPSFDVLQQRTRPDCFVEFLEDESS